VHGAPAHELQRSSASLEIARQAARSQLFFAHFERRAQLPVPAHWLPEHAQLAPAMFVGGVLPESKYQSFRHDLLVASFHPSHRAQWTAHELCHGLVGFAYRPGASTLFHVLAAWLAELVPVALWYFFDEVDLRRCPRHRGGGPLFQAHCAACEREAERGPGESGRSGDRARREGMRFVKRELAAIRRSRRLGRPVGTRFATIDLAEDAVSYVAGHGPRLRAPEMERFSASFFGAHQGQHSSLEALEARVLALCESLCGGSAPRAWRATRWDYAAQDVGYRLLTLRAQTDPAVAQPLDRLIDRLAAARSEPGLRACVRGYRALFAATRRERSKAARALPAPETLFALGYALPDGLGCAEAQMRDGIASACPSTWQALGARRADILRDFCAADRDERVPIGRRFAAYLSAHEPGALADLARVEAAITHVAPREPWLDCLDPFEAKRAELQLAPGVEIVRIEHDVLGSSGSAARRARAFATPRALLVLRRVGASEVDVLELPAEQATHLAASAQTGLPRAAFAMEETTLDELVRAGVLVPTAYTD
jgi:hypothetical protein